MKACFKTSLLVASLGLVLICQLRAQTFTNLHRFTTTSYGNNNDGAHPYGGLILSGSALYGTASSGGNFGFGTLFALSTDGTGFTNLHSFSSGNEGDGPGSALVSSGDILYGTTVRGGSSNAGTVFAMRIDGTGFTNLHSFSGADGANPYYAMNLSGDTLFGTTSFGGIGNNGTIFQLSTNGAGFTNVHYFSNTDGADPVGLTLSAGTLYGVTGSGGSFGYGTVFAVNTDGTDFTNLHNFAGYPSDGNGPNGGLVLSGTILYGAASKGGSSGSGTVFAINTNGTGFTNLYNFTAVACGTYFNSDGAYPYGGLILSGNTLYGAAVAGGSKGYGTVFAVNTNGTGFRMLCDFAAPFGSNGTYPATRLLLSGNTLYGTAAYGGGAGSGTVFSIFIQPQLTIIPSGPYVILVWPTNYSGFTVQSTTNPVLPGVWTTVSPAPVVIGGQNVVVNTVSGIQQFYRLSQSQ